MGLGRRFELLLDTSPHVGAELADGAGQGLLLWGEQRGIASQLLDPLVDGVQRHPRLIEQLPQLMDRQGASLLGLELGLGPLHLLQQLLQLDR